MHQRAIYDGINQFFFTQLDVGQDWGKKEVKSSRGCDIRSHGLDLPGTPWVVPHECHEVGNAVEQVIWVKVQAPIILDDSG